MSKVGAPFRVGPAGAINVLDATQAAHNGWTSGAAIIDTVQLPIRSIGGQWIISGLTVTADLYILNASSAVAPPYGKLGVIQCGLSPQGPQTSNPISPANPYVPTLASAPLPRDGTLITPLFDPAVDPLPPTADQIPPTVQGLLLNASVVPPQPLIVPAGGALYVGMWCMPGLVSSNVSLGTPTYTLMVCNAQWEIIYAAAGMGQGPTPPPPGSY